MKKTLKIFGLMLLACATMLTACDKDNENDGNNNGNGNNNETRTYTINVTSGDEAMGTVTITPDSARYHAGTEVTIAATPNSGYKFIKWTGTDEITANPYTFAVSANANYTAVFEALPQATYSATFDGQALDIAGYSDYQTNGELWLLQFASQAEGTTVSFPYLVMWMQGTATSNFSVYPNGAIELYKDTYYTAGSTKYGDWQYYATESITCTLLDLTSYMLSFTGAFTMYDLGDIVNETTSDPAECTHKTLQVTVENATFTVPEDKSGFHKMNVK